MGVYLKKFETHAEYENYINGSGAILPNVSICTSEGDVHYNPYVEPVDPCASEIVKTTYELVDLGLPSGVKWANKNIGAESITDYGQKFSWGGVNGYTHDQVSGTCHSKAYSWSDYELGNGKSSQSAADMTKYNSTDGKTVLDLEDDAAHVNMGGSWRMPTEDNFNELLNTTYCTSTWTTVDGVSGYLFTSKANGNTLFFPAAGYCGDGSFSYVGSYGRYWSSSLIASNVVSGRFLYFYSGYCYMSSSYRNRGFAVRGVVG